jgi:3-deoxy-manno-octulosonate cytidylyltransferase (CMP-KDO synthetase)
LSFDVIIPARYGSTRLPGKPLRLIAGKPMVQHAIERAVASGAEAVWVATDDERIGTVAMAAGAQVCMTSREHRSGTDRLAEAVCTLGHAEEAVVVNLQGDEPLMPPRLLRQVAEDLDANPAAAMSTLCMPITAAGDLFDPNVVKVVMDASGLALYFSRAPIPWHRDGFRDDRTALPGGIGWYRHLGLYAYRVGFLKAAASWPCPAIEQAEALEQLRALWHGVKIRVSMALEPCPPGVDTEADLSRAETLLSHAADV